MIVLLIQMALERQLELEARFVAPPEPGRRRARRQAGVPAPLRLYVSVRVAPRAR